MERLWILVKRRPVALSAVLLVLVCAIGVLFDGPEFIYRPLPVSQWVANTWLSCNLVFSLVTFGVLYRNVLKHEDLFTWQEMAITRGVCWMLLGSVIDFSVHLLTGVGSISLGTPGFTLGMLAVLYGAISDPERFTKREGFCETCHRRL